MNNTEIKEPQEITATDVMIGNPELIASAFNAIAAVETYNAMTVEDTETINTIKKQSLEIIAACIAELHEYTIS